MIASPRVLWGFWHNKPGADPKLVAYGWGCGEVSEALQAFRQYFPSKSLLNLTLTTDRSEEEYMEILQGQLDGEKPVYPGFDGIRASGQLESLTDLSTRAKPLESVEDYLVRLGQEIAKLKKWNFVELTREVERVPRFFRKLDPSKAWSESNAAPVW